MSLEDLLDRAAIEDLLDGYAEAVDARSWERLAGLFSADAVLDYSSAGGPRGSRDEVLAWIAESLPAVTLTQHLLTNRRIRVTGDRATARTELLNPLLFAGDEATQLILLGGRYDDELVRTDGGWVITQRIHMTSWTAGPVPAQLNEPEG